MRKYLFTLMACISMSMAAKDFKGQVKDENGTPIQSTNVVLLNAKDSTFVQGTITNEDGRFVINSDIDEGILRMSYVGYETQYVPVNGQSSEIVVSMSPDSHLLGEVTVTSKLPQTRVKADAMLTHVAGTVLEKVGKLTDVLDRIPNLSASGNSVTVFGRGDAEVYINGRKVLDNSELDRLLSSQIQSVEVIQNPGARYAATVKAVVRIQLKKNQGDGISIIEDLTGYHQYNNTVSNNLSVNYRHNGVDLTASMTNARHGVGDYGTITNEYISGNNHVTGYMDKELLGHNTQLAPQLMLNWQISNSHSAGIFYKYDHTPEEISGTMTNDFHVGSVLAEQSNSDISMKNKSDKHIINGYYNGRVGKLGIDVNLDMLLNKACQENNTLNTNMSASKGNAVRVKSNTDDDKQLWAGKLVLTHPLFGGNVTAGAEYSYTNRSELYDYHATASGGDVPLPARASETEICESMTSVFIDYGRSFGKLYAQVGLRYEYLVNDYYDFGKHDDEVSRKYGKLFPSLTLAMPVGSLQMSLTYRKDIVRPAYSMLSSDLLYIDAYTYQMGNPYLKPSYMHSLMYNIAYKWANLTLGYTRSMDDVITLMEPFPESADPLISLLHPINNDKAWNRFVISPFIRPTIGCWTPMLSASIIFQDFESTRYDNTAVKQNRPFAQIMFRNDIRLPKSYRLGAHFQLSTKGDNVNTYSQKNVFHCTFYVQKDISLGHYGTLIVDARAIDTFGTQSYRYLVYGPREISTYRPGKCNYYLNAVWKFNEARSKWRGTGAGASQKSRM